MKDAELRAHGLHFQDAEGALDTPEKRQAFHRSLGSSVRADFAEYDEAKRRAWELAHNKFID